MSSAISGYIFVLISALLYGSIGILAKIGYSLGFTPGSLLVFRYGLALLILSPVLRKEGWRSIFSSLPSLAAVCAYICSVVCYFYCLEELQVGIATIIFFTHPLLVATLSAVFDRTDLGWWFHLSILVALAGVALLSLPTASSGAISLKGLLLALAGTLFYALYTFLGKYALTLQSPEELVAILALFSCVFLALAFPRDLPFLLHLNWKQATVGAAMAILNTVLSIYFFLQGVKMIGPARASLVGSFEPVFTLLLASILLKEHLVSLQWLGAVLTLTGILLSRFHPSSKG